MTRGPQRTKGPEDQRTRGPGDQRTKGPEDQRTKGPEDQGTRGPKDQRTRGLEFQGTKGPEDRSPTYLSRQGAYPHLLNHPDCMNWEPNGKHRVKNGPHCTGGGHRQKHTTQKGGPTSPDRSQKRPFRCFTGAAQPSSQAAQGRPRAGHPAAPEGDNTPVAPAPARRKQRGAARELARQRMWSLG